MDIEIRGIAPAELHDVARIDSILFGNASEEEELPFLGVDRFLCAFDGGQMVGTSAAPPLTLTLPGGARVAMAGVTWVGVLMTHRRHGVMRRLITDQLAIAERAGEPVAGLGASQSLLYRRFGFGPATRAARVEIETLHGDFIEPLPAGGRLQHVELNSGLDLLVRLHAELAAVRSGMVSRPPELHRYAYRAADKEKDGAGPMCFVVHRNERGEADGVLSYRVKSSFDAGEVHDGEVRVEELLATTEHAGAALWRHCLDHDLVRRVVAPGCPVDEPVADRLADPRRWTVRTHDQLHLRPLDVAALLAARRYGCDDALTIEVQDPLAERLGGRFRVEGGIDGARASRVRASPDISLGTAALGSILLGDAPVERLQRAGFVEEHTPGAARRATAMFAWSPLPWASYIF